MSSRTASEIWSATLSGCPSDTDSDVKRWLLIRAVFPAEKVCQSSTADFTHPTHTIPLSAHAIPAAVGGASPPGAATRSGRGTGLDCLSLLTALPGRLQAQPRRRGAERFSAASCRHRGGG